MIAGYLIAGAALAAALPSVAAPQSGATPRADAAFGDSPLGRVAGSRSNWLGVLGIGHTF